jgi:uncharacterized protein (TIGR03435 family)
MLRAMLADRFKLAVHVEDRDEDVFDLVLARKDGKLGSGITPTDIDCVAQRAAERAAADAALAAGTPPAPQRFDQNTPTPRCTLRVVSGRTNDGSRMERMDGDTTMADLASYLRTVARRPVIDKTGLAGFYRVTMTFDMMATLRPSVTAPPSDVPSIFTAVQQDLGLKLEPSRAVGGRLVIDRLERPAEN